MPDDDLTKDSRVSKNLLSKQKLADSAKYAESAHRFRSSSSFRFRFRSNFSFRFSL